MKTSLLLIVVSLSVIVGCSTMTPVEKEQKRSEIDAMAESAIADLVEQSPEIQAKIDGSLAYAVADMKLTKIPVVGAGGGQGVLVDKETQQRIYFTVSRFDLGGGWGVRAYKALLVIESQKVLERARDGTWEFQAGAEASAGSASAEGSSSGLSKGFSMYVLSEAGASVTVTARVIRIKVNNELTE
ncbi:MAG: hypothetical protein KAT12_07810 [Gammaproteobacteria bacterium]|nr:hypothetical protein [Gammaproteobacteria bacterium]